MMDMMRLFGYYPRSFCKNFVKTALDKCIPEKLCTLGARQQKCVQVRAKPRPKSQRARATYARAAGAWRYDADSLRTPSSARSIQWRLVAIA